MRQQGECWVAPAGASQTMNHNVRSSDDRAEDASPRRKASVRVMGLAARWGGDTPRRRVAVLSLGLDRSMMDCSSMLARTRSLCHAPCIGACCLQKHATFNGFEEHDAGFVMQGSAANRGLPRHATDVSPRSIDNGPSISSFHKNSDRSLKPWDAWLNNTQHPLCVCERTNSCIAFQVMLPQQQLGLGAVRAANPVPSTVTWAATLARMTRCGRECRFDQHRRPK